jgi:hypothetical protein
MGIQHIGTWDMPFMNICFAPGEINLGNSLKNVAIVNNIIKLPWLPERNFNWRQIFELVKLCDKIRTYNNNNRRKRP